MPLVQFVPYRAVRVATTAGGALLRYYRLARRERRRGGRRPTQADWDALHERNAKALHDLVVELRGVFVKGCQILGARADILPKPYIDHLGRFHDRVPPRPFAQLRRHVEHELGSALSAVFAEVDEEPLAAASLAQVHRARLRSGEPVVIKVQYPEARRLFPMDLANMRRWARIVERVTNGLPLGTLAGELTRCVALELDFRREAASAARIAAAFGDDPHVRVPHVHDEYSTERLLVIEYVDGIKITEVEPLRAAGFDLVELARQVARIYVTMIFDHGFFHADPHPGNLLVTPNGTVGLLDFGLVKALPTGFGDRLASLLLASVSGDVPNAVAAAQALGFELRDGFADRFPELIGHLFGPPQPEKMLALLGDAGPTQVPPDLTLVLRVLILLNGLSYHLAPGEFVVQQAIIAELTQRAAGVMTAEPAADTAPGYSAA